MGERLGRGEPLDAEGALVDREGLVTPQRDDAVGHPEPHAALESAVRAVGRGVRRGGGESGHWIQENGDAVWSPAYAYNARLSTNSCKISKNISKQWP